MRDVEIRDDMIRLGQLLKLAGLVEDGAEAKEVLEEGLVKVNGAVETRRGKQITEGDEVILGPEIIRVVTAG
ncbi:RNA-binding S4 domain-containing protein [Saccharopolyspora sp. NPDC002376]